MKRGGKLFFSFLWGEQKGKGEGGGGQLTFHSIFSEGKVCWPLWEGPERIKFLF